MAKLEVFQNGNFSNGDPVYQIGTKNSEGGYDVQVFDLMSEAEAKAKLKTMGGTKAEKPVVQDPVETTLNELSKMTKLQLEEFAREFGVELDRRQKKDDLVNQAYESQFDG
tara:strand:+ start:356 stop:688 length:333 start_codon:yes stop_codon:yes gene_type:complete